MGKHNEEGKSDKKERKDKKDKSEKEIQKTKKNEPIKVEDLIAALKKSSDFISSKELKEIVEKLQ